MAGLGPFENSPLIAVGVSGGADSLALCLLADRWARGRGGRAVALTVDHALRPESSDEASQVGRWLAARGICHQILVRQGARPTGDIQAAARGARHALLRQWCSANACLHVLLAHHAEDQAETVLLRLARGSGVSGASAMAAVSYYPECRVLRPLLSLPRERLRATVREFGQVWIEDPSNDDPAYARVRMRQTGQALAAEGLTTQRLCQTAYRMGRARHALEDATESLLSAAVCLHPWGWARLDPERLRAAADDISLRALGRILTTIGGGQYGPRLDRLERVWRTLGIPATLGNCRLSPQSGGGVLVVRENRNLPSVEINADGSDVLWDGRFRVRVVCPESLPLSIRALEGDGWKQVVAFQKAAGTPLVAVPAEARPTLPAIYDRQGLLSVPYLGYERGGRAGDLAGPGEMSIKCRFAPRQMMGFVRLRLADPFEKLI